MPKIEGYRWLTNVSPHIELGNIYQGLKNPVSDEEIAKFYANRLKVPVEDVLVRDVTIEDASMKAVYIKESS